MMTYVPLRRGLSILGLAGTLVRAAVAQQKATRLYSVPESEPHALVRLRIGATPLETEKGGWVVALDSVAARVAFRLKAAEITLRVTPGPHVLRYVQYRQEEHPEPHRLAVGSQVYISAIFEEGGDYAVELSASKLRRLNCACFVAYRVNGGEVVRSFLVTDEWAPGGEDRSFPSLPPPSTGARRGIAKKLHIGEEDLPADWQDSRKAERVVGTYGELELYPDGSAVAWGALGGYWRQHGNRVLVSYLGYGSETEIQVFLSVEGLALVGSETVRYLDDDTVNTYARRYAWAPLRPRPWDR